MATNWADDDPVAEAQAAEAEAARVKDDFPPLGGRGAAKKPVEVAPRAKKKTVKMSLNDFAAKTADVAATGGAFRGSAVVLGGGKATDKEILKMLPTGSRGKVEGEEVEGEGPMGGGFKGYGGDRGGAAGGFRRERGEDGEGGAGFMPSRAEEAKDWGADRQFVATAAGGAGAGGGFGSAREAREPRQYSEADGANDWGANRQFVPATQGPERRGMGTGGFRDGDAIRPAYDAARPVSKADQEDQWSRGRPVQEPERVGGAQRSGSRPGFGSGAAGAGGSYTAQGESRPNSDADKTWGSRRAPDSDAPPSSSTGTARPRLNLTARTLPPPLPAAPVVEPEAAAAVSEVEEPAVPKVKVNPFGAARPREAALKEKGVDPVEESSAPAPVAPAQAVPAQAPIITLSETPAEREARTSVESLTKDLEALRAEGDADEEDVAEAEQSVAAAVAKLAALRAEREEDEVKAREAAARGELDGGDWVTAQPAGKRSGSQATTAAAATAAAAVVAAAAAAAPVSAPAAAPAPAAGGPAAGRGWGRSGDSERTGGDRQGGAGGRGGAVGSADAKPSAAGAPGAARKW